jgi:hypothetical protein
VRDSARAREESTLKYRNLLPMLALKLMTVRSSPQRSTPRPRLGRRTVRRAAAGDADVAPPQPQPQPSPQARERAAGGPEDRAAYRCSCGYVFEAPVSTTVGCPHCGGTQAW